MFAESQRVSNPIPASTMAISAISPANVSTVRCDSPLMMASIVLPASTGVATAVPASTTLSSKKQMICFRSGRANPAILRKVTFESGRCACCPIIDLCSAVQAVISM